MTRSAFVALATSLSLHPALACGGFFCDTTPIMQASERILFAVDDDEVEAHVQINYSGTARQFAWVVPVPEIPELFASTDELFSRLDEVTRPRFDLTIRKEDCLEAAEPVATATPPPLLDVDTGDTGDREVLGVTVVARGDVGPYETRVLEATDEMALLVWLNLNGYQLPASYAEVVAPYLDQGSYFVALRLQNDRDVGEMTPLGMRYASSKAGIPLVLTSIAALPDMRVDTYVLGPARAVPDNYLHVRVNPAAIDWFNKGDNYEAVITEAANEAGGHGFATDFARPTSTLSSDLFSTETYDTDTLRTLLEPGAYVDAMFDQGVPPNTAVMQLLERHIPMPASVAAAGVTSEAFYACVGCYAAELQGQDFDPGALTDRLIEVVVEPMDRIAGLLSDHAWLTRMRSSVSPEEMTLDPTFTFNVDMPEQRPEHHATLVFECDGGPPESAQRRLELPDGLVARVPSADFLQAEGLSEMAWMQRLGLPASLAVEMTATTGEPMVITDNAEEIRTVLDALGGTPPARPGEPLPEQPVVADDPVSGETAGCGCASTGGAPWWVLMAGVLVLRRRER